jgi:hypothetical protein
MGNVKVRGDSGLDSINIFICVLRVVGLAERTGGIVIVLQLVRHWSSVLYSKFSLIRARWGLGSLLRMLKLVPQIATSCILQARRREVVDMEDSRWIVFFVFFPVVTDDNVL